MFFFLSKFLWYFINPLNLFFILFALGSFLLFSKFFRIGRILLVSLFLITSLISVCSLGDWVLWKLENRFVKPNQLPDRLDGIVVAGGILDPYLSSKRERPIIGGSIERLTVAAKIAQLYPEAKILFSGGSGDLIRTKFKEAHYVLPILSQLGVSPERVLIEDQARNTFENGLFSKQMAQPKKGEFWLLITSAFHMPRAMGTFRRAGWKIFAFPVDYGTSPIFQWTPTLNVGAGLMKFDKALHECLGLLVYWITEKSDFLFPGPDDKI